MIYSFSPTTVIFAMILFVVVRVTAKSYDEDIRITAEEKTTLEKFKETVIPQIPETSIVRNYIKDDLYFIRWLRAATFDIEAAERMLLTHLKWREEQNMDTIYEEDWSDFKEYPIFTDTHDKEGRPAAEFWLSDFNIGKAVSSGNIPELARWTISSILETGQRQLYEARAKGRNISHTVMLVDIGGFNLVQHACPRCMTFYATLTLAYLSQYPGLFETVPIVNVNPTFDTVFNLVKLLLGPTHADLIKTYVHKSEWDPVLDKKFEKEQRSPRFGGTKARDNHFKICLK